LQAIFSKNGEKFVKKIHEKKEPLLFLRILAHNLNDIVSYTRKNATYKLGEYFSSGISSSSAVIKQID
jgi:hypothetical protein